MFERICMDGVLDTRDIIPKAWTHRWSGFPDDMEYRLRGPIEMAFAPTSLYTMVQEICETHDLGFRLTRHRNADGEQKLYFNIYAGLDRSAKQKERPSLLISKEMGHLKNMSETTTIANNKNIAYVVSKHSFITMQAPDYGADTAGFDRKVASIVVTEIDDSYSDVEALTLMRQKGNEALSLGRKQYMFDGEVGKEFPYKYEEDYRLGDILEFWGATNMAYLMRVTEQIFVSDASGERAYPTFSFDASVTPGSWLDQKYIADWVEMVPVEQWYNQE